MTRHLQCWRFLCWLVLLTATTTTGLEAQFRNARSADYLFPTSVTDVRATWMNPAGLATVPEASIMGEVVVARLPDGDLHFDQYTVGLNSRGFSIAYQRDRFDNAPSTSILRISTGLAMSRGAIGVSASWYGAEGPNDRDVDIGALYGLTDMAVLSFTVQHIGRAEVAGVKMPIILSGGAGATLLGGRLLLAGEGKATERLSETGFEMSYRGGAFFLIPTATPVMLLAAGDMASNFNFDRLHFGVAVGSRSTITAVATGIERMNDPVLDRVSLTGVASNVLAGR